MAHLLVIDDEEGVRNMIVAIANMLGHSFVEASNGVEGLDRLLGGPQEPDVIFVNGDMPGMGGVEFLRRAASFVHGRIPCIFDSGYGPGGPEGIAALEAGAIEHLPRPWRVEDFYAALKRGLLLRAIYLREVPGAWPDPSQPSLLLARCRCDRGLRVHSPRGAWRCLQALMSIPFEGRAPWTCVEYSVSTRMSPVWQSIRATLEQCEGTELDDRQRGALLLLDLAVHELRPGSGRYAWHFENGIRIECGAPAFAKRMGSVLHCTDGPAALYCGGFRVYALHGRVVPRRLIESPETITVSDIRRQRNVEVRRWLRERYGHSRYLIDIGARLVHVDTVPVDAMVPGGRTITRALLEDDERRRWLVASDGSTRRVYHMEVPTDCATCRQAYVALSGRPDVRTIVEA